MISFSSTKSEHIFFLHWHVRARLPWQHQGFVKKAPEADLYFKFEQRLCLHYIRLSFLRRLRRHEKQLAIVWTGTAHNWNKLFTHVDHLTVSVYREGLVTNFQSSSTSEYLLLSQRDWTPVLATSHLLPIRTEKLFTLQRRPIHQRGAASLQKSRRNRAEITVLKCEQKSIRHGFRAGQVKELSSVVLNCEHSLLR